LSDSFNDAPARVVERGVAGPVDDRPRTHATREKETDDHDPEAVRWHQSGPHFRTRNANRTRKVFHHADAAFGEPGSKLMS